MSEKLKIGAVIYAPQVTVIWGIIADFFEKEGFPIEPVYFKDYKGQVDALLNNEIDVAWNSPLAWLDGYLRSGGKTLNGAMRDTDQDRQSYLVVNDPTIQSIDIGITESGTPSNGKLKSAIGIGGLLLSGIGDTLRVSLTDDPVQEVLFGQRILEAVGLREKSIEIVSCPTCGRTEVDLISLAEETENRLVPVAKRRQEKGLRPLKVAVMGCVVNGPGESREADYGIAGGKGEGLLFSHGEIIGKVPENQLVDRLIEMIEKEE